MNEEGIKNWTILIYADGNNDLAPEMCQSILDAEREGSSENVNVIMEIGRESDEFIKIIRPSYSMLEDMEVWTGVRRYYILKPKSIMLKDLGDISMADPLNLYDFITWGMKSYPAKHYMLVLSGHGGGFIGAMSDLSQDKPYLMGIYEMCTVINRILIDIKAQIDILVFDICEMNYVETMYELGKSQENTVKNVVTYIENGPINGLPYDKLTNIINLYCKEEHMSFLLRNIVEDLNLNLVAVEINHIKLKKIKELVNRITYIYLKDENSLKINGFDLVNKPDGNTSWYKYALELKDAIKSVIVHTENRYEDSNVNTLNLIYREMCCDEALKKYLHLYYKLAFVKDNYWFFLFSNNCIEDTLGFTTEEKDLMPIILSERELKIIIWSVNPHMDIKEIEIILKKLIEYKKWDVPGVDIS